MNSWKGSSYGTGFSMRTTGFAWDLTIILIAAHILSTLACALISASGYQAWLENVVFSSSDISRGYWGSLFLYPFYHDIAREHIWFAIEMLMFFWFGREVERTVGKLNYGIFYFVLAYLPPLIMFALKLWLGSFVLAGSNTLHFTIFLTFVLLYPDAPFFFGFTAKWLGIIFLGISTLAYVSQRQWAYVFQLWCSLGIAALALPWMKNSSIAEKFSNWKIEREEKRIRKAQEQIAKSEEDFNESVDHILEKISKQGIQSLTSEEKKELERARAKLMNKR